MRITFLGLSAFLIESTSGDKILLEPYDDRLEYQLGAHLPKNLSADLVLSSHQDPDHYNPSISSTKPNLKEKYLQKSVLGNEYNGDQFEINVLDIDGLKIAHFADQSLLLNKKQLIELGKLDIIFYSPPKVNRNESSESLEIVKNNLKMINPKLIFWSHYIVPSGWHEKNGADLKSFFKDYLKKTAKINKNYRDTNSFIELYYILENALKLNHDFNGKIIDKNWLEITKLPRKTTAILFSKMW